jgi:geranylgeranyl reductase family protein
MKQVAVIGGGPAGAIAAERIAAAGGRAILFDEKLAWEKPCGGGVTFKAAQQFPFLTADHSRYASIAKTRLEADGVGGATLSLTQPLLIFSRKVFNGLLLERAARAGADLECARILSAERSASGWSLQTRTSKFKADFLLLASGARNNLRHLGTQFAPEDAMIALGYFIPASRHHIDLRFFSRFEGYIWIFPRNGHLSAGICGKGESAAQLRTRLETYLTHQGIDFRHGTFYAHALPALASSSWPQNRIAGPGWLAAGDAAGLVDPVTGEGIYYAMRSGEIAGNLLANPAHTLEDLPHLYRQSLQSEFLAELSYAATLSSRLFLGTFLQGSNTARLVQFLRRSPRIHGLLQELFAGTLGYFELRRRVKSSLKGTLAEIALNLFLRRIIAPDQSPAS